ncbi:Type I Iterative PKS [Onygenales sp. PD_40]|nr:Type I Iterative PKS [Onygenales sp. PD_40]
MTEFDKQEPIAIIGAACRLPGEVSSLGTLWDMISHAKSGHGKIPAERWDADVWHHPDPDRKGSITVKHGYFLTQDISHFDAPFFSTTAKEAAAMDPTKRLLLEVCYESIENAGIPVENLMNSQTGCYVGCMMNDYEMLSLHDIYDIGHAAASANSEAMTANRVSWFFGCRGPSLTLDTACSSSLYALHLACQSLRLNETEMGLVAGVNLLMIPNTFHQLNSMHMLSPEGISHTFDSRANGYGRGEGIGCLIVKRLSDALRDGDTIRAVIRGTGANADGKTPSITQPSSLAQADLINRTYEAAGLSQASTEYFECHGTGTPVGDPIELNAIASTIGASRAAAGLGPLYIGSIKPNVGHTEGCSGLAGIFKAILCLEKGMLVPTYGVEELNPKLTLADWNLALPEHTMKWPSRRQRRISVNSFGFGGANAHAILDDAYHYLANRGIIGNHSTVVHEDDGNSESGISVGPGTPLNHDLPNRKRLFLFSTKDQAGIQRLTNVYSEALNKASRDKKDVHYLDDLAYTLSVRRSHFDFRSFAVAPTLASLSAQLSNGLPKIKRSSRQDNNLIFVFTGQGAQWERMGVELLSNSVFRNSVETSQNYLKNLGCQWDAIEELQKTQDSNISFPEYSQTLCTVLQIALVDLLRHWKVRPKATVGHSSGEIAAAYTASYISHADAVKIAYVRGLSSASVTRQGAMLAAGLTQSEAQDYLSRVPHESAVVACINSPSSVTLSGDIDAINTLDTFISADGKFARKLKVKTAYHSPHMRDVAQGYLERIGHVSPLKTGLLQEDDPSETLMFSSLTGKLVSPDELNAQYWVSNMCSPVEFSAALSTLLAHTTLPAGGRKKRAAIRWGGLVEIGPHSALQGPVQQVIATSNSKTAKDAPYISMVVRGKDATDTALTAAGQLWALGYDVDLSAVNEVDERSFVAGPKVLTDLPSYPWNHSRSFWHESNSMRSNRFPPTSRTDLLGVAVDLQNNMEPKWRNLLRISENPWIEDHKITGTILYPAAGMIIMALEGALQTADSAKKLQGFRFSDIGFERGLVVTSGDDATVETSLSLKPQGSAPGRFEFTIFSTTTGTTWTKHCSGIVALEYAAVGPSEVEESGIDIGWVQQSKLYSKLRADTSAEEIDVDDLYDHLETIGMEYGPLFRNVTSLSAIPSLHAAHGAVLIPDTQSIMPSNFEYPHTIHPATMDAIFHLLLAAFNDGRPINEAAVPYSIEDMFISAEQPQGAGARFHGYGQLVSTSEDGREMIGELIVSDEAWLAPKLTVKGFALRQVTSADSNNSAADKADSLNKCARVQWNDDVDFIQNSDDFARLQDANGDVGTDVPTKLSLWLDRLTHKAAVGEVLVVLDDEIDGAIDVLRDIWARTGRRPGFQKVVATTTYATGFQTLNTSLPKELDGLDFDIWDTAKGEEPPAAEQSYDLVFIVGEQTVLSQSDNFAKLQPMLSPNAHVVIIQSNEPQTSVEGTLKSLGFSDRCVVSETTSSKLFITSATSSATVESTAPSEIYLLLPSPTTSQVEALSSSLTKFLASSNIRVHTTTLSSIDSSELPGKHVLSLLEAGSPLIYSWSDAEFTSFKSLISSASHIFWITHGGLLQSWDAGVEFAPAQGLLRVLRNEYTLATLPHLDLSKDFDLTSSDSAELIMDVWRASLAEDAEMEYAELKGAIFIPRAVEDVGFDGELRIASGSANPAPRPILESGMALKIGSALHGGSFLWVEDEDAAVPLNAEEVEIEVEFVGFSSTGSLDSNSNSTGSGLGNEAVGIVSRCGDNVRSVTVGQRVAVVQSQTCRTHIRQHEALVAQIPGNILPEEAAALSIPFITAQYALLEVAGLSRGQTILLHSAASALGQAAIQIAQFVGAQIFALVASKDEKNVLVDRYKLSLTCIFDSSRQNFVPAIERATDGRGVDIVLSNQHNPAVIPSLACLGDFGYFLDLGTSTPEDQQLNLPASKRNASLVRIGMDRILQSNPGLIKVLFQRTFQLFCRSGMISPITPTTVFSISEMARAFDTIKSQNHGKVVLSLNKDASVLMLPPPAPKLLLDKDATYVLSGGLGALGLDIADMMIQSGAGNLVFLSRSGGSKNEKELAGFRSRGVNTDAFKCDVNDSASVTTVFDQLKREGRVIKGVVQCAMVLEDTIFDNMTHDKWSRAILPKTHGSKNLLAQLSPADSPFFILLSSITGIIGNTAQANYASGNTFEDALAHYARSHLSIPATSIDVGLVSDSSHFTTAGEFGDLENYLHKYQHGWSGLQTSLKELRVVLEAVMRGSTANGQKIPAQLVLGLGDRLVREPGTTGFERDRKFDLRVISARNSTGKGGDAGESIGEKLRKATSLAEAAAAIEQSFKEEVGRAIGVDVAEIDVQKQLPEFGVDSLKAVEIRNRTLKEMQSDISVFELLSNMPIAELSVKIASRSALVKLDTEQGNF